MALQTHPVYQADRISHEALAAVSQGENESIEDDVYSLNEDLMINSITDYGRHPYRYGIASVNFKGNLRGSRGAGNAKLRKLLLGQLHGQTYSSIVFVQECPWKDPLNHLQLKEKFRYTGVVNESGVIWNSEQFGVKRLDSYILIGDKYPKLMQHRARLCICEVTLLDQPVTADNNVALEKTPNVSDFIAISWHGPHKCADKEKRLVLRDLLEFVMYIKNKNGPKACVIGGDFNFSIENAYEDLDSYVGLAIADSYELETIDYFIFTSDLINILHAKQLSLEYDAASIYTAQDIDRARAEECKADPDDVIDHKPVFAVLDLGSPNPFSSLCNLPTKPRDKPQVQRLPPPAAGIPASTAPSSGATGVPRATITKTPNVVRQNQNFLNDHPPGPRHPNPRPLDPRSAGHRPTFGREGFLGPRHSNLSQRFYGPRPHRDIQPQAAEPRSNFPPRRSTQPSTIPPHPGNISPFVPVLSAAPSHLQLSYPPIPGPGMVPGPPQTPNFIPVQPPSPRITPPQAFPGQPPSTPNRPRDKPQMQRLPPPAADIPASTAPSSGATGVPRATITKTPNVVSSAASSSAKPHLVTVPIPSVNSSYVTMANPSPVLQRPGGSGQNHSAGRISPEGSQVLSKRRLQDLVREIDSTEQLDDDDDVEELLLQVADDFIENVVTSSCQLAKHRKSNTLETKDVQMHLERNWNMYIPGFGTDDIRPYQKACTTEAHKQRMALIRKTLKK